MRYEINVTLKFLFFYSTLLYKILSNSLSDQVMVPEK